MRKCKHCGEPIKLSLAKLRGFCSYSCRDLHKKTYNNRKRHPKVPTDGVKSLRTQNMARETHKNTPDKAYKEYGGKEWHDFAKKYCCNYRLRQEEGLCYTLSSPVRAFKVECGGCNLGLALRSKTSSLIRMENGK